MTANVVIRFSIVSRDEQLVELCGEVLRKFPSRRWELTLRSGGELPSDSDICLWDYEPGLGIQAPPQDKTRKDLYLVHPQDLVAFQTKFSFTDGKILLKPTTRAVLEAFLGLVLPNEHRESQGAPGDAHAERDEILECLLHANLRLQEYDHERTNFLSSAVHDFRAPLTALSGFCGLLATGQLGRLNRQQKNALQRMQHSSDRLLRMASSMFELSINRQVNRTPNFQQADIRQCIDQVAGELRPLMEERHITLRIRSFIPPSAPLYFEPLQIEQVLINLLDNAFKATPKNGLVEVCAYPYFWERRFLSVRNSPERRSKAARTPNGYRVDVRDTGPGISPEEAERLFEEYSNGSTVARGYGTGLGLAICKLILSRHGGSIWADKCKSGALLSFVLPYRQTRLLANRDSQNLLDKKPIGTEVLSETRDRVNAK